MARGTKPQARQERVAELRAAIGAIQKQPQRGAPAPADPQERAIAEGTTPVAYRDLMGAYHVSQRPLLSYVANWRRLLWAASKELGEVMTDVDKAAIVGMTGPMVPFHDLRGTATLPASYLQPLAIEKLAVEKLAAIADRAYALAAGLDELIEPYLEDRNGLLEDLDEGDTWEDFEPDTIEPVTPDGYLTIASVDAPSAPGGVGVVRTWSADVEARAGAR
ncbi:MAG: hypothetical protein EPN53_16700 [Acidobacteria bacterium]|nr:MAG: hypothetical protein EPN53_16700 [Acidobacteriota bacterium]